MNQTQPAQCHRPDERGIALILGILFTIIVMGITVAGAMTMRSHQTHTRTNFVAHGQAIGFARSGLTEALGWLRKQTSQPVTTFAPQLDPSADPPVLDTADPAIGIVREFRITGPIWGRYEVWKDWPEDPDPERRHWRNQFRVLDVSRGRGDLPAGSAWRLRCVGYVFRRTAEGIPFNVVPNQVLGQDVAEVEVRRLALQPPGQAALCAARGGIVSIQSRGRIYGGGTAAGIYYLTGSGVPTTSGPVTGTPGLSSTALYNGSVEAVFGVSLDELKSMADVVVANAAEFPSPVPPNSLIVCTVPNMTFDVARPLRGTGVVVCTGTMTIQPGSNSNFSGLLHVGSSLTLNSPADIQGAVVAQGSVVATGTTDFATITYDDGVLNSLRQLLGSYRMAGSLRRPLQNER